MPIVTTKFDGFTGHYGETRTRYVKKMLQWLVFEKYDWSKWLYPHRSLVIQWLIFSADYSAIERRLLQLIMRTKVRQEK